MTSFAEYLSRLPDTVARSFSDRPGAGPGSGSLSESAYPNAIWAAKTEEYAEYEEHFSGEWLNEQIEVSDDRQIDRYPLKYNVFRLPVMLHASFLFGEIPDSSDPLVEPVVEVYGNQVTDDSVNQDVRKPSTRSIDQAKRMSEFLNEVWYQNEGRAKQLEAGITSQIYGGCVFGVAYDPTRSEPNYPLRIDHLLPNYFYPVWAPNDAFNLVEVFVKYFVSKIQAQALYGVSIPDDQALYMEHWKRDGYEISIGGEIVKWNGLLMEGTPLGGFVPYTYIPHPPRFGGFYGESLLKDKLGLSQEINARMSDIGDIIAEEARRIPAVANANKLSVKRVSGQLYVLDTGPTLPGQDAPQVWWPSNAAATSSSSIEYVSNLINTSRLEAYTPPIVYGLDEGSQRSALTLALRMIPLVAHIRDERTYWATAMTQINRQLLVIAAEKGIGGITMDMVRRARIHHQWSPMLPRDAEQELNQILLRLQANVLSPETAMQMLGDIQDIRGERNLILQWMKDVAEAQSGPISAAENTPKGGSMGEQSGMSKPQRPQANINAEE